MQKFKNVELVRDGEFPNTWQGQELLPFSHRDHQEYGGFIASPTLFLIRQAWHKGVEFEDLADGFGPGVGTHGDWSAIRDSTPEAVNAMLTRTLNAFFGNGEF